MIIVFPIVRRNEWLFRLSVADAERMMIMAFGPTQQFELKYFVSQEAATEYIDTLAGPAEEKV